MRLVFMGPICAKHGGELVYLSIYGQMANNIVAEQTASGKLGPI